ncbi:DNA-binding MarR family transcriptional regulator [Chitinophaga skermanii]|uniref:DNA-binding MarR family transcriptional regulator n=1 Tax=Chitinophaga skermanii TaxID=331697 RepID=A0A327QU79_9BACT|nr:MarR family transcriptional regulator [Chitinophaga skermanii]RAJ05307.1 DNA-binding MarR family transcriptional regulator [Chitinophaga skermanii]
MSQLKLEEQLCFPLYALSRKVITYYTPLLEKLDLTYPQYLVMLVLWQEPSLSVKELGERLYLDSGTLSPLLKRLEAKKFISRKRNESDERIVIISLLPGGEALKSEAASIPLAMQCSLDLSNEDISSLRSHLYQIIHKIIPPNK